MPSYVNLVIAVCAAEQRTAHGPTSIGSAQGTDDDKVYTTMHIEILAIIFAGGL